VQGRRGLFPVKNLPCTILLGVINFPEMCWNLGVWPRYRAVFSLRLHRNSDQLPIRILTWPLRSFIDPTSLQNSNGNPSAGALYTGSGENLRLATGIVVYLVSW